MMTIDAGQSICTVIHNFKVTPENHEEIFELLKTAIESEMCKLPGYKSASLHLSDDTKSIIIYEQWRSLDDYNHMLENKSALALLTKAAKISEESQRNTYHIIWEHSSDCQINTESPDELE